MTLSKVKTAVEHVLAAIGELEAGIVLGETDPEAAMEAIHSIIKIHERLSRLEERLGGSTKK